MTVGDPLFPRAALSRTLAWRDGRPISVQRFLAQAAALAERLPAEGQPVNLCSDRYLFLLGFVAGLMRGQMSLLPPNAMPQTLRQVAQPGATPYALVDDASQDTGGLHAIVLSHDDAAAAVDAAAQIPTFRPRAVVGLPAHLGLDRRAATAATRWRALTLSIEAERRSLAQLLGWPTIDGLNIVATVPAQHSYGFESSVLLALLGGAAFDVGRPFYPADIAEALARLPRPRALVTTPVHLKALLGSGLAHCRPWTWCCRPPRRCRRRWRSRPNRRSAAARWRSTAAPKPARSPRAAPPPARCGPRSATCGCTSSTAGDGERFIVSGGHVLQPTPLADLLELIDAQRFRLLGRANDLIHVAGKRSSLAHLNFHLNRIAGVRRRRVLAARRRVRRRGAAGGLRRRTHVERASDHRRAAPRGRSRVRAAPRGARGPPATRGHRQADDAARCASSRCRRWRASAPTRRADERAAAAFDRDRAADRRGPAGLRRTLSRRTGPARRHVAGPGAARGRTAARMGAQGRADAVRAAGQVPRPGGAGTEAAHPPGRRRPRDRLQRALRRRPWWPAGRSKPRRERTAGPRHLGAAKRARQPPRGAPDGLDRGRVRPPHRALGAASGHRVLPGVRARRRDANRRVTSNVRSAGRPRWPTATGTSSRSPPRCSTACTWRAAACRSSICAWTARR